MSHERPSLKHVWFDFSETIALINREELEKVLYESYALAVHKEVTPELIEEFRRKRKEHKSGSMVFVSLGLPSSFLAGRLTAVEPGVLYQLADKKIPGVLEEIKKIIPISIFSNNKLDVVLPALGLPVALFTHILGPNEVKNPKPDPEGFNTMITLSKVPAEEIMYIGDDIEKDLLPAKALGIQTGLLWKGSGNADYCFKDFSAILDFFQTRA